MGTPVSNLFGEDPRSFRHPTGSSLWQFCSSPYPWFLPSKRGTSSRDAVPIVNVDQEDVVSATKSTTSAQINLTKEICALSGASSRADARTVWNARTSTTSSRGASIRQRRWRNGLLDCRTDENQMVEFFLEF